MKKFLIIIIAIFLLILLAATYFVLTHSREIEIEMNKTHYGEGEMIFLQIRNNLKKDICFSSCAPYYVEVIEEEGTYREPVSCNEKDIIELCMKGGEVKSFRIEIKDFLNEKYRLAVPVCFNCLEGQLFEADTFIYSNNFSINRENYLKFL